MNLQTLSPSPIQPIKPPVLSLPALLLAGVSTALVLGLQLRLLNQEPPENLERALIQQQQAIAFASNLDHLGYENLGASWLWLSLIQYYGDKPSRQKTGYQLGYDYLDAITDLDPYFLDAYLFAPILTIQTGRPEFTRSILLKGTEFITPDLFPQDAHRLYVQLALNDILFLGYLDTGKDFYYKAADILEQRGGNGDDYRDLANRIVNNPDTDYVRFKLWDNLYKTVNDPDLQRSILINHLIPLGQVIKGPNGEIVDILPPEEVGADQLHKP